MHTTQRLHKCRLQFRYTMLSYTTLSCDIFCYHIVWRVSSVILVHVQPLCISLDWCYIALEITLLYIVLYIDK